MFLPLKLQVKACVGVAVGMCLFVQVDGVTPLARAAQGGHVDIVPLLLAAGAAVDSQAVRTYVYCEAWFVFSSNSSLSEVMAAQVLCASTVERVFTIADGLRCNVRGFAPG